MKSLYLLLLLLATNAIAQDYPTPPISDLEKTHIYLHTVDPGNDLYSKFGHSALRIHDEKTGWDQVYNWGIFDFSDPQFIPNFYRGILIYRLGDYPNSLAEKIYRAEGRRAIEDELSLNEEEKKRLVEKIIWNTQKQNRFYNYQYYDDNCATRIRDYIDEAVGLRLSQQTKHVSSNESFRQRSSTYLGPLSFVWFGLNLITNSRLDRTMSSWQQMFLPEELRRHLSLSGFLSPTSRVIAEHRLPKQSAMIEQMILLLCEFGPILILLISIFRLTNYQIKSWLRHSTGMVLIFWGIWSSFASVVMICNWLFSKHLDLHHNANLLFYWPIDLIVTAWGFSFVGKEKPYLAKEWISKNTSIFLVMKTLAVMFTVAAYHLGLISQSIPYAQPLAMWLVILMLHLKMKTKTA